MNRKFGWSLAVLLASSVALAACDDDRPGRHRPPPHGQGPGGDHGGPGGPDRPNRYP